MILTKLRYSFTLRHKTTSTNNLMLTKSMINFRIYRLLIIVVITIIISIIIWDPFYYLLKCSYPMKTTLITIVSTSINTPIISLILIIWKWWTDLSEILCQYSHCLVDFHFNNFILVNIYTSYLCLNFICALLLIKWMWV